MTLIIILFTMIVGWLTIYYKNSSKTKPNEQDTFKDEYIPFYIEDDYLQIEIVPKQNRNHILKEMAKIEQFSDEHFDGTSFTDIYVREDISIPTRSIELRTDYVASVLKGNGFEKAEKINHRGNIRHVKNSLAFGFPNFTVFVDTYDDGELVKTMWVSVHGIIMHVWQRKAIVNALYDLGTSSDFVMADWNSLEVYDLSNENDIEHFLQDYWK